MECLAHSKCSINGREIFNLSFLLVPFSFEKQIFLAELKYFLKAQLSKNKKPKTKKNTAFSPLPYLYQEW